MCIWFCFPLLSVVAQTEQLKYVLKEGFQLYYKRKIARNLDEG